MLILVCRRGKREPKESGAGLKQERKHDAVLLCGYRSRMVDGQIGPLIGRLTNS